MKRILALGVCFALMSPTWAASSYKDYKDTGVAGNPGFYLGVGAGGVFPNVSGSNSLATGTGWPNDYYNTQSITDEFMFLFSGGYTWSRSEAWFPYYSLGVRLMDVPVTTVQGAIDQYSLPGFKNYNYQYDVALLSFQGMAKVDVYNFRNWLPYFVVGAGVTNYSTSSYKESATANVTPRVNPAFGYNSGNNFSYTLGVGVDYIIQENLWANLEYNFNQFGNIQTGNGANYGTLTGTNYSNESLKNSITSNTLFLGLTYYIR